MISTAELKKGATIEMDGKLWSIMDFLNEGLLGSRTQFTQTLEHPIVKQRRQGSMSALARLVQ